MKECSSNNSTSGASDHTDGDNDQDRETGTTVYGTYIGFTATRGATTVTPSRKVGKAHR